MMKFILSVITALGMVFTTAASDISLFNAKEFSLSLGSGYVVDYKASSAQEAFAAPYDFNLNAGLQYFLTKNFGIEVDVPFYQTRGVSIGEVQAGLLARLPLSSTTPILKNLAPYVGFGGAYGWDAEQRWTYIAKAGIEARLNDKWGIFTEASYRNTDFTWDNGATAVAAGLRLVF